MFVAVQYAQKRCSYRCGYMSNNSARQFTKPRKAANCLRCGADLSHKKSHAIYCSKTCKSMDHNFKHRGRTRVAGVVRRTEIIQRDGSTCYLCNKSLAISEVELDHLIPVAQGGTSEAVNLAVACRWCNRSRGARLSILQILKRNQNRSAA
jgi:5-methylcytosine-specific restriction endonuclease McrA